MIEKYAKYTSLVSLCFFIGAVWFEFLYYQSFGIDIFTYISLSEIVGLFISKIPLLLFIGGIVLMLVFILNDILRGVLKSFEINPKHNRVYRLRVTNKMLRLSGIIFVVYFLLVYGPLMFSIRNFSRTEGYFIMKVFGHAIFLYWIIVPLLSSASSISKSALYVIVFIVIFYVSIYFFATYSLWSMKNHPLDADQLTLTMKDDQTLTTSDTLLYVGKTNNYVFFYNTSPKNMSPFTLVINSETVKAMKISKQVAWFRIP